MSVVYVLSIIIIIIDVVILKSEMCVFCEIFVCYWVIISIF